MERIDTVSFIANTRTEKGLRGECKLDGDSYQKGIKISDKQMKGLNIFRAEFHGEWNYTITPEDHK